MGGGYGVGWSANNRSHSYWCAVVGGGYCSKGAGDGGGYSYWRAAESYCGTCNCLSRVESPG
jgi:hypothetical protein